MRRIGPIAGAPMYPPAPRRRIGGGGGGSNVATQYPAMAQPEQGGGGLGGLGGIGMMAGMKGLLANPAAEGSLIPAEVAANWGPLTRVSMMGLDDAGGGATAGLLGSTTMPAVDMMTPMSDLSPIGAQALTSAAPEVAMEIAPEVAAEAAADTTLAASGYGAPIAAASILSKALGFGSPFDWIGGLFD